jgi:hypothetical protein
MSNPQNAGLAVAAGSIPSTTGPVGLIRGPMTHLSPCFSHSLICTASAVWPQQASVPAMHAHAVLLAFSPPSITVKFAFANSW